MMNDQVKIFIIYSFKNNNNTMPITNISFSQSQENINKIGLRSWKRFGAEYQIIDGESLEDAKKMLKSFVYESLKKQPDELPEDMPYIKEPNSAGKSQDVIDLINKCTTIPKPHGISAFEIIAKTDKTIQQAFDNKFKELSQQTK